MGRIVWASLLMLQCMDMIHSPVLDLLEGGVVLGLWCKATDTIHDKAIQVLVLRHQLLRRIMHNGIVLWPVQTGNCKNPLNKP